MQSNPRGTGHSKAADFYPSFAWEMTVEVWFGTEVIVAKQQKVIDRANTVLLDVRGTLEW